ncbi:MAG: hypothetical protein QOD12_1867, partial [Verrucomicrobiota bacterium]
MSVIDDKYDELQRSGLNLGAPRSQEGEALNGGRYRHFEIGSIYWHRDAGVHEVHGSIYAKWEELHWERGFLGYPLSDEQDTSGGRGRFNEFQGGFLYWDRAHSGEGAYVVSRAPRRCASNPITHGQWSVPSYNSGVVGTHIALLRTQKVLFFNYRAPTDPSILHNPVRTPPEFGDSAVLDLTTGILTRPLYRGMGGSSVMPNLFCSGHAFLPDGRLVIAGGDREHPGQRQLHIFTPGGPEGGTWEYMTQFPEGRFYPSCVTLHDGRVLVAGGADVLLG